MTDNNRERVTVTLPPDLIKRIDDIAELRRESRSQVIVRMIMADIDNEEAFIRHMSNPAARHIVTTIMGNPAVIAAVNATVGKLVGAEITPQDADHVRQIGEAAEAKRKAKSNRTSPPPIPRSKP